MGANAKHNGILQVFPDSLVELPVTEISMTEHHQRIRPALVKVLRIAYINSPVVRPESIVEELRINTRHGIAQPQVLICE